VLLDVQMPEMSGFEVIEAIGVDRMPPVVFITAYDAYALRAFDVFAFGYLLKPLGADRLAQTIERVRPRLSATSARKRARSMEELLARPGAGRHPDRLVVRSGGRVAFVRIADVEWVEACGNYSIIHAGGRHYDTRETMYGLNRRLGAMFARIHRSYLINLPFVVELRTAGGGEYDVVLRSGRTLRVTRRFRPALEQRLASLP
jgi:two-component system LytT family response regulator